MKYIYITHASFLSKTPRLFWLVKRLKLKDFSEFGVHDSFHQKNKSITSMLQAVAEIKLQGSHWTTINSTTGLKHIPLEKPTPTSVPKPIPSWVTPMFPMWFHAFWIQATRCVKAPNVQISHPPHEDRPAVARVLRRVAWEEHHGAMEPGNPRKIGRGNPNKQKVPVMGWFLLIHVVQMHHAITIPSIWSPKSLDQEGVCLNMVCW